MTGTEQPPIDTRAAFGVIPRSRRVALISCSAKKLNYAAPARDLYVSTLFRKSVAYAEATCDGWYVLSAKHGLLSHDEVVEPYDQRLEVKPSTVDGRPIPTNWAGDVSRGLAREIGVLGIWSTTFVVLAGGMYEENLRALSVFDMTFPLAGMQIGQRLQWLTQATTEALDGPTGRVRAS